jgi:hypothetical protein
MDQTTNRVAEVPSVRDAMAGMSVFGGTLAPNIPRDGDPAANAAFCDNPELASIITESACMTRGADTGHCNESVSMTLAACLRISSSKRQ